MRYDLEQDFSQATIRPNDDQESSATSGHEVFAFEGAHHQVSQPASHYSNIIRSPNNELLFERDDNGSRQQRYRHGRPLHKARIEIGQEVS